MDRSAFVSQGTPHMIAAILKVRHFSNEPRNQTFLTLKVGQLKKLPNRLQKVFLVEICLINDDYDQLKRLGHKKKNFFFMFYKLRSVLSVHVLTILNFFGCVVKDKNNYKVSAFSTENTYLF
jgi:hypothetical protein